MDCNLLHLLWHRQLPATPAAMWRAAVATVAVAVVVAVVVAVAADPNRGCSSPPGWAPAARPPYCAPPAAACGDDAPAASCDALLEPCLQRTHTNTQERHTHAQAHARVNG